MSSRLKIWTGCLMFLACLLCGRAEIHLGDVFPSLDRAGLAGGEPPSTAGKVALVDFWASWCAPCKASFPAFARLHEEFNAQGLVIVAVSVDEKPVAYAAFIKQFNPPFATRHDSTQQLVNAVDIPAMPASFLLDRHGRVRFLHVGFHGQETERELHREIETLLAEKA